MSRVRLCTALAVTIVIAATLFARQQPATGRTTAVTPDQLLVAPPAENWPTYNGDYTGRRYSSLSQINTSNVAGLHAAWVFHPQSTAMLETTPVVINGIMFATAGNDAYALDARTGRELWRYTRPLSSGLIDDASAHHNRGVAVWGNRLYMETDNAHLLALDARSGHLIWDISFANPDENYGATSAPLALRGNLLVGPSGGDDGVRGFIAAYDHDTGAQSWRFWTMPRAGDPAAKTWAGTSYLYGGGSAWMPGTYDAETNTLFWGIGNPGPVFDGSNRAGDNLYSDCVVALDPDTGRRRWHFQFTPHDVYDYDATQTPMVIDAAFRGANRKLLVQANRNGFLYFLDRTNGALLYATPFVRKLNWATSIGEDGRPHLTGVGPADKGSRVCPGIEGATNWYSPSYNPQTGLFYFFALEQCQTYFTSPGPFKRGRTYYNTGTQNISDEPGQMVLLAYRVADGTLAWRYPQINEGGLHAGAAWGGTMATAGGLVFFGDPAGSFEAVDGKTGKPLWHFNTGQDFHASPMSYSVEGTQYVAVANAGEIFSFSLH